ncbi:MAG TPA: prolipoprotein diacylglyceryl transferase [Bacteroidales bacterium]
MLSYITWTFNPTLIEIGSREIRWYGLCWAVGFLLGYTLVQKIFRKERLPEEWADKLFIYVLAGSIIGSRIGHCVFYDWSYYSEHLLEIFYIWQGGLASHGGAIGIIIAVYLYSKFQVHKSMLWTFDHFMPGVCVGGAFIRLGNLFNHEIYGNPTDLPWGFRFVENLSAWMGGADPVYSVPSHPTQIYEILYCLITLAVILYLYYRTNAIKREGLILGVFLIGIFGTRFFVEFIKEPQEAFEQFMILNMGQLLSIPFIIWGTYLIFRALRKVVK